MWLFSHASQGLSRLRGTNLEKVAHDGTGVSGLIRYALEIGGPSPFERSFKCFLFINLRRSGR